MMANGPIGKILALPKKIKIIGGAAVLVVLAVIILASGGGGAGDGISYRTGAADHGPVVKSISSTGTLSAVVTVLVGSQVSGQIIELPADFNSRVTAGQVIARIDPATFQSRVGQAEAELAVANANVIQRRAGLDRAGADLQSAEAQVASARTRVTEANNELARKQALLEREFASQAQVDTARTARSSAIAALNAALATVEARTAQQAMAEADILTAEAQVLQRTAALANNQVDLDRTFIRSPVDGVVIERKIDIGQTVAASLQAPDLFTIAQDLRDMQVEVSVDEADIGQVREGLTVKFNVDAFPGEEFQGNVRQVRLAPDVVQNVVTYKVIVAAANPDQRLLPGMTANVEIIAGEREDALRIPNAALRFLPEGVAPQAAGGGGGPGGGPGGGGAAPGGGGGPGGGGAPGGGGPGGGGGGPGGGGGGPGALVNQLVEDLELDEEQEAQVREIASGNRQMVQELRAQGVPFPQIRGRIQAALGEAIKPLMRPEQLEKFAEIFGGASTTRRVRVWVIGDDGTPTPLPLVVGISDNSHTEVVRVVNDDLEDGDEIIIGVDLQAAQNSGRRVRFGF